MTTAEDRPTMYKLDPTEHPDPLLTAASVAGNGWPVLAIRPGTKAPLHHGAGENHRSAWLTTAAEVVASAEDYAGSCWECSCPSYAALTGQTGRGLADGLALVCLDLDGEPGDLAELLAEAGPEAENWAAETLRVQRCDERAHLWGIAPAADVPPTGRLTEGLEWRGTGGYVLLPGSLHPSGMRYAITAGRLEFTEGHAPAGAIYRGVTDPDDDGSACVAWAYPLPVPESLLAAVVRRLDRPDERPVLRLLTGGAGDLAPGAARMRLAGVLSWLGSAEVGERNDRLNKAAGLAAGLLARVPERERVGDLAPEVWRQAVADAGVMLGLDRREAERTTASGWDWGTDHPTEDRETEPPAVVVLDDAATVRERFPVLDLAALVDPDRPVRRWVWADVVPEGDHVSIVAPAGAGKSLLVLALAVAAVRGAETFAGRALSLTGRVFYVDMENSADDWSERLTDLGVTPENVGELSRLLVFHLPRLRGLDTEAGARDLLALLDSYDARAGDVLVLDSTQRVTEGDENSNDTLRRLYVHTSAEVKRRGLTVIRTDNTGWDRTRERGASNKRDDVGYSWLLTPDEREPGVFTLTEGKRRGRPGAVGGPLTIRRHMVGGVLRFDPARSTYGETLAHARALLAELGVPESAGMNKAWTSVREAKAEHGDGPRFAGMTRAVVERAQSERGRSVEVVADDC
ncbi:AAA family ATPase [Nocardioides caeni]|uniref:DNA primase/polymerase bifunctional N-terminal domain-containing protein n=1 Tax=Nocardioides caeni TaxID=574700 RepID=A0A4S8N373_9ACTN|nr:AAA family ATPase [Nocardioides caeni]THV10467.1 hypothetical protein E9934_14145 [Nocardioides caeni]